MHFYIGEDGGATYVWAGDGAGWAVKDLCLAGPFETWKLAQDWLNDHMLEAVNRWRRYEALR